MKEAFGKLRPSGCHRQWPACAIGQDALYAVLTYSQHIATSNLYEANYIAFVGTMGEEESVVVRVEATDDIIFVDLPKAPFAVDEQFVIVVVVVAVRVVVDAVGIEAVGVYLV